jgi:hypothetical protein
MWSLIRTFFALPIAFLHGVQLLRKIHTWAAGLQHVDHGRKVPLGAFEPRADLGKLVNCLAHGYPIPLDRINESA